MQRIHTVQVKTNKKFSYRKETVQLLRESIWAKKLEEGILQRTL